MVKDSVLKDKSIAFAIRIVKLYKYLSEDKKENILSKQILRSGTAIGAMIHEAQFAESTQDFAYIPHVALKEANETSYWFIILEQGGFISMDAFDNIKDDLTQILKMLVASINTSKNRKGA